MGRTDGQTDRGRTTATTARTRHWDQNYIVKANRLREDLFGHAQTSPAGDRHPQAFCHRLQGSSAQKQIIEKVWIRSLCTLDMWQTILYIYIYLIIIYDTHIYIANIIMI